MRYRYAPGRCQILTLVNLIFEKYVKLSLFDGDTHPGLPRPDSVVARGLPPRPRNPMVSLAENNFAMSGNICIFAAELTYKDL